MTQPSFRKSIGEWQVTYHQMRPVNHPSNGATEALKLQLTWAPPVSVVNGAIVNIAPQTWTYRAGAYVWSNEQSIEDITISLLAYIAEIPGDWDGPALSPQARAALTEAIGTDLELALNPPLAPPA